MTGLQTAVRRRERAYADALDRLRDDAEPDPYGDRAARSEEEQAADLRALREAVELVKCLRRLLEGRTVREIHSAFGAPGDFGYETAIGDALARTYRGEVTP